METKKLFTEQIYNGENAPNKDKKINFIDKLYFNGEQKKQNETILWAFLVGTYNYNKCLRLISLKESHINMFEHDESEQTKSIIPTIRLKKEYHKKFINLLHPVFNEKDVLSHVGV